MSKVFDLIISEATIVAPNPKKPDEMVIETTDIGVSDQKITAIGSLSRADAKNRINARGLTALPGAIDSQVHFRDPGYPEKEDLVSGSRSAIAGGVTTFFDMPNTKPPTLTSLDLADKLARADKKCWANYAFYMGASPANLDKISDLEKQPHVCGFKIFMGSSTGNLIIGSDENLERAVKQLSRPFAVHAEDENRLKERRRIVEEEPGKVELHPVWRDIETALIATKKIVGLAEKYSKRVHVLHVTTAEEVAFFREHRKNATFEITPQHLTFAAPDCYAELGTLAQMNPPIREKRHQDALWGAIRDGIAMTIGSDHAPHTLEEKAKTYPQSPSGMTGVQTLLPLLLNHMNNGRLSLTRLVELTSRNPAKLFGVKGKGNLQVGHDADIALVDLKAEKTITNSWIESRCGWTPYNGYKIRGWVAATLVNGTISMRDGEFIGKPMGRPCRFIQGSG